MRVLDASSFKGSRDQAGAAPSLLWVALSDLRVDDTYQRPITRAGERTIAYIAANFRWSRFSPVIIAPAEGGGYSIIDGQHRATAALACGFETVPCQVVLEDKAGQAAAFSDINARTTAVHSMAVFKAALAGGEPEAVRIDAVARAAGVTILKYPVQILKQGPGETMAISALKWMVNLLGDERSVAALRTLVAAGGDAPGMVIAPIIRAVALVFSKMAALGHRDDAVASRLSGCPLLRLFGRAELEAKELRRPVHDVLASKIEAWMCEAVQ